MVSKTTRYAIWVLALLAGESRNGFSHARGLAKRLGIPAPYLAKVLFQLSRNGMVESVRGRTGGYRLREGADRISLKSVLEVFEPDALGHLCIIGNPECPGTVCPEHRNWNALQQSFGSLMERTTIADIVPRGKCFTGSGSGNGIDWRRTGIDVTAEISPSGSE